MEPLIQSEVDLKREANKHHISFSVSKTNEEIATELLKRQILQQDVKTTLPHIPEDPSSMPEIEWKEMSCYIDALVMNLIQPHSSLDDLLYLTTTYHPHSVSILCNNKIERVREVWRQTLFNLFQSKRTSLRPFLVSLSDCEDIITQQTPFWRDCLNDPLEFIKNVFIPILMTKPEKALEGMFREKKTYKNVAGHAEVPAKHFGDIKSDAWVALQVLNVGLNEIQRGDWLSSSDLSYVLKDTYDDQDTPVFITKKDWEFNGTTREFIYKKGTDEERKVGLVDRTDDIGSQIESSETEVTPFHPTSKVILLGLQKTDQSETLNMVPTTVTKGGTTWQLQGSILFKRAHYTSLFRNPKLDDTWFHYDSLDTYYKEMKESDAIEQMKREARCLIYCL